MKKIFGIVVVAVFLSVIFSACKGDSNKKVKYVFYFIGDGMGLAQTSLAESYLASINGEKGMHRLSFNDFPSHGYATTFCQNRLVTGSAAAGTALASGKKTSVNTIGLNGDHSIEYIPIAEKAKRKGYKVGIVSSVSIDHATPASFYAHQPSRNMYYDIACDLVESNFDYFGGGGFKYPDGKKNNQKSVFAFGQKAGYQIINEKEAFVELKSESSDKVIAYSPVLTSGEALYYRIDQKENELKLKDFTRKGIQLLDNEKGFFMMVEGGKIDWACHANDAAATIHEVIDFEEAIQEAVKFYNNHPDETLIVVTADHETGGLGLGYSGMGYETNLSLLQNQKASMEEFEKIVIQYKNNNKPVFDEVLKLVSDYYGLNNGSEELALTDFEKSQLRIAFQESFINNKQVKTSDFTMYGGYEPVSMTATKILNNKAGIGWTTYSHTASPVPVRAIGKGHSLFNGYYDNTDIPSRIEALMGLN